MISNQVLQNTIEGLKEISHLEFGIMDADGREVAVTAPVFADASGAIPDFALHCWWAVWRLSSSKV